MLARIDHVTDFTRHFGPLSGNEAKTADAKVRQLLTIFAYGTHLGPHQMARHLRGLLNADQIAHINRRHFTAEKLEAAIRDIVNRFHRFTLPRYWGVETYGDMILPLELEVTDQEADHRAITRAHQTFGRLDVVINNAGYGLLGAIEEISVEKARDQMETNFFGALWVTQAALPYLREQGSGHILQVSSIGGICAFPGVGLYHASKWALQGMSEALAQEVAKFGIHVTLIEPGGFDTDWRGSSAVWADPKPAYAVQREVQRNQRLAGMLPGDPVATSQAILTLVDAPNPPLRIFLGNSPLRIARAAYERRLKTWEEWDETSQAAQGN